MSILLRLSARVTSRSCSRKTPERISQRAAFSFGKISINRSLNRFAVTTSTWPRSSSREGGSCPICSGARRRRENSHREFCSHVRFLLQSRLQSDRYQFQSRALLQNVSRPARGFRCPFQDRQSTSLVSSFASVFLTVAATSRSSRVRRCRKLRQRE